MSGHSKYQPKGRFGAFIHAFEENVIAALLGVMTLLVFLNVIRRYVFNASLIWSLEVTLTLFSWLVLFGIAYGFKVTAHLGVDAVLNIVSRPVRRVLGILTALLCLYYAILFAKGAWDYWAPFAELPPTTGRWFPTGLNWDARGTSYFETDQIPIFWPFTALEDLINYGEGYSKMPRVVPYTILPVAGFLILYRIGQAALRLIRGEQESLIVSHEAEDAVEEVAAMNRG